MQKINEVRTGHNVNKYLFGLQSEYTYCIVLYCKSLLTMHVKHNINVMQNTLKGHKEQGTKEIRQIHKWIDIGTLLKALLILFTHSVQFL